MHRIYKELGLPGSTVHTIRVLRKNQNYNPIKRARKS